MNVVNLQQNEMANFELWNDRVDILRIKEGTYSHTNFYKRLRTSDQENIDRNQNCARAKRIDTLVAPRSFEDVCAILGDTIGDERKIYSSRTLTTFIISDGILNVWVGTNPSRTSPMYRFKLTPTRAAL